MKILNLKLLLVALIIFTFALFISNIYAVLEKNDVYKNPKAEILEQHTESISGRHDSRSLLKNKREAKKPEYAPDELIVKLKEGSCIEDLKELNAKYNVVSSKKVFKESVSPYDTLTKLKDKLAKLEPDHQSWYWQLDKDSKDYKEYMEKLEKEKEDLNKQISAQEQLIERLETRQKRAPEEAMMPNLDNIYVLKMKGNVNIVSAASDYSINPLVEYAEPNRMVEIQMIPNDPYYATSNSWGQGYDDLWGLKKIEAASAWDTAQGEGVIAAVVDTGVDYNHEDISTNIWVNALEIPNDDIDNDNNGYVDDVKGYDFSDTDADPQDYFGHGTHVAGTVAAVGNNSKGIIGVAPKTVIMPVKIFPNSYEDVCAVAVQYSTDNGADIINCSWGGSDSSLITDAVNYAISKGVVVVAAAGNDNTDVNGFSPANITNVIAVAAIDQNDNRCYFSNYGAKITVSAPGGDNGSDIYNILSLLSSEHTTDFNPYIIGTSYLRLTGTSMACPHVVGLASLILSKTNTLTVEQVTQVIKQSVDVPGIDFINIPDKYIGSGRTNLNKALNIDKFSDAAVSITSPAQGAAVYGKIDITGTASDDNLASYTLYYSDKIYSNQWETLITSTAPIVDGVIYQDFDTDSLSTGEHLLKLKVVDTEGAVAEFTDLFNIDREWKITNLLNNDILNTSDVLEIKGIPKGDWSSYIIEYGKGADPVEWFTTGITLTNGGVPPLTGDILAKWDMSSITQPDYYTLRLTVNFVKSPQQTVFVRSLLLDPNLKKGWPLKVEQYSDYWVGLLEPVVADINKDGFKEIIFTKGESPVKLYAFSQDGSALPGWPVSVVGGAPGGNLYIPLVGDLNNDGFEEIIVNDPDYGDYEHSKVYAFKYDGTILPGWPVTISGDWHPTFAMADLDLDGNKEVIVKGNMAVIQPEKIIVISKSGVIKSQWDYVSLGGIYEIESTPAVGNFDDDPELEIVVSTDFICIYNLDGTKVSGWPVYIEARASSAAVGDINKDGKDEVVVGSGGGGLYAFDSNGNLLSGFPVSMGSIWSSPALADFDNDGDLEIVVNTLDNKTYVVHHDGGIASGWPQETSFPSYYSSIVGDVNGDRKPDVLTTAAGGIDLGGGVYAWNFDGTPIAGFPKATETFAKAPATISDIDKDGKVELVASSNEDYDYSTSQDKKRGSIYVWEIPYTYNSTTMHWPTFHHDNRRTGVYIDVTPPTKPVVTDGGAYTSSTTTLTAKWTSSDPGSGIAEYKYKITQDSPTGIVIRDWTSTGVTPSVTATGLTLLQGKTYYFSVKAKNGAGLWSAVGYSNGIKVDTTAPTKPVVTDEGVYTNSTTTLNASWSSSDTESGIAQYQYRITQDTINGTVIRNWTSTGVTPSVTATGLTLLQGKTYYFSVKAKNGAGLWSAVGYSDGIKVNTPPTKPTVTGPSSGVVNTTYSFTAQSSDADGDYIHLNFIFLGTDAQEHLVAIWYNNPATQDYSWDKAGNYYVKVSAEDDKGGASGWTKKDIVIK